jgi:hypothetical protein
MKTNIHRFAGGIAFLTIATFWTSTVVVETFGSDASIALVKRGILWGMILLIPALITTAGTGAVLGKKREGKLIAQKKGRMPIIAMNGMFVLVPSALFLNYWASRGEFTSIFYIIQGLELIAGAFNVFLIGSSIRDGLRITGKLKISPSNSVQ